jgi:hypothetical protein
MANTRRGIVGRVLVSAIQDLLFFGGVACVGVGLWQIYPPATWLFCGGALIVGGVLSAASRERS